MNELQRDKESHLRSKGRRVASTVGSQTRHEDVVSNNSVQGSMSHSYGSCEVHPNNFSRVGEQMRVETENTAYITLPNATVAYQPGPSNTFPSMEHSYANQSTFNPYDVLSFDEIGRRQQQAVWIPDASVNIWNVSQGLGDSPAAASSYGLFRYDSRNESLSTSGAELGFNFDETYFASELGTEVSSATSELIDPNAAAKTFEADSFVGQLGGPQLHSYQADANSSASDRPNPSMQWPQQTYDHSLQTSDVLMSPDNDPWSIVNPRWDDQRQSPLLSGTTGPFESQQSSSSSSALLHDGGGRSFLADSDPAAFNTEVDMITSCSTIRPNDTNEQDFVDSTESSNCSQPRSRFPVDLPRFRFREDTPSREVGMPPQSRDTVVIVDPRHSLSVPTTNAPGSERSSYSSGASLAGPSSPMSVTSPSVPPVLICGFEGCLIEFSGQYRRGNLRRHQRLKHEGNQSGFMCEDRLCPRTFKRKDARTKHYRNHHSGLAAAPIPRPRTAASSSSPYAPNGAWSAPDNGQ